MDLAGTDRDPRQYLQEPQHLGGIHSPHRGPMKYDAHQVLVDPLAQLAERCHVGLTGSTVPTCLGSREEHLHVSSPRDSGLPPGHSRRLQVREQSIAIDSLMSRSRTSRGGSPLKKNAHFPSAGSGLPHPFQMKTGQVRAGPPGGHRTGLPSEDGGCAHGKYSEYPASTLVPRLDY